MKIATSANSTVSPLFSFSIMPAELRAAMAARPVTAHLVAGMLLADGVKLGVELVDDRQSWLESLSGTRPATTTASCSASMNRRTRCSGDDVAHIP